MADKKISALTAQTGANVAAGDLFPNVDISDTTDAASGTDKSITFSEFVIALAASSTFTAKTSVGLNLALVRNNVIF